MVALIGLAYILNGIISSLIPPKKINLYYGYRTKFARKNQEIWDYANKRFIKISIQFGIILIIMEAIYIIVFKSSTYFFIERVFTSLVLLIIIVAAPLVYMEMEIREKFKNEQ